MESPNPVPLAEEQIEQAGALLSRAFHDNPLLMHMSPNKEERRSISPSFLTPFVRYGHLVGEVWTTEDVDGIAIRLPPTTLEMDSTLADQAGLSALPTTLGAEAFARVTTVIDRFDELRERDARFPHWYLALIGVEPSRQRRGIANSLLRLMLDRADSQQLPCYLETAEPTNVPLYLKYGFDVVDEVEPISRLRLWTFLRPPAEHHS